MRQQHGALVPMSVNESRMTPIGGRRNTALGRPNKLEERNLNDLLYHYDNIYNEKGHKKSP